MAICCNLLTLNDLVGKILLLFLTLLFGKKCPAFLLWSIDESLLLLSGVDKFDLIAWLRANHTHVNDFFTVKTAQNLLFLLILALPLLLVVGFHKGLRVSIFLLCLEMLPTVLVCRV